MKFGTVITGIVILGVAGFAGYRYWEAKGKQQGQKSGQKNKAVIVNMVMPEKKTLIDERRFSGTAYAWSEYDVKPEVAGRLQQLAFDIGDTVKKGDKILQIDDTEFRQQVRQAEANLEYARAKLKEAQVVAKNKTREFERHKTLVEGNAVAISSYDQAESDMTSAVADVEMCAADLKRLEAVLDNARTKLADTVIMADWKDGSDVRHIGKRHVDEGALLSVGESVVSIVELDRIKAYVQIIERDYPLVSAGQKAEITTDAYPGQIFEGVISNVGNILSDKTRSATAVISINNKDCKLRPGMFIRARLQLGEHKDVQVIPVNAVIQKNNESVIFRSVDGKAVQTKVQTGLQEGNMIEIISPVITDPVVTIGNHLLTDGKAVEISELSRAKLAEKAGTETK